MIAVARLVPVICLVVMGVVAPATGGPMQEAGASPGARADADLEVKVADGLMTMSARNVPLGRVLEKIIDQTDLVVKARGALERPVTVELTGVPLSEGLDRILRNEAYMLYDPSTSNDGSRRRSARPTTLWIFSGDPAGGAAQHATGPAGVERDQPDIAGLQQMLLSDDERAREQAVKALRRLDADSGLAALAQALGDPGEQIRVNAVYGLADIGGEQAAAALISALSDSSPRVRQEAAYALGVVGGETALQALPQALHDTDPDVREAAILAYAELGGNAAVNALASALQDPEASLRLEALEALRDTGRPEAIPILRTAVDDPDAAIRKVAITALGELGGNESVRALGAVLNDGHAVARMEAVEALGDIESRAAQELLARVAASDVDRSVREAAAALLPAPQPE